MTKDRNLKYTYHLNKTYTIIKVFKPIDRYMQPSYRRQLDHMYCTFLGGNSIIWKSKKLTITSRSSLEDDYKAMTHTSCKLMWIKHLVEELRFDMKLPMNMIVRSKQQFILPLFLCFMSKPSI